MHHYVYRLDGRQGEFYFGSRTSPVPPKSDPYMGSGVWPSVCKDQGVEIRKTVIGSFATRQEACDQEKHLIKLNWLNPSMQNRSLSTPVPSGPRSFKNPLACLLDNGFLAMGPIAVCAYITLIGTPSEMGISSHVLARYMGCSVEELNQSLFRLQAASIQGMPTISHDGNAWKSN
jgi:hypothetical protein